jgi:hypothetical protein
MLAILVLIVAVPLFDWGMMSRLALTSHYDYRYWPLSSVRLASVILVFCACMPAALLIANHSKPPTWVAIPVCIVFTIWGGVGLIDLKAQMRRGERTTPTPPRYSDPLP